MNFIVFLVLTAFHCTISTPLNVHIIPHSHDDPGWLKTADQYYSGSNNTIYLASVQYIFDSVIDQLQQNSERTYSLCEMSFFTRWWAEQADATKSIVRELIKSKRIAVLNGGWVMHDEASSHYVSMIDQTALGHAFLKKEFGYCPKVGWQIDPFGHSNTHAWLSSEFGFDALFFGRIDYQDHDKRMAERTMELIWKGSSSQKQAAVFTGAFTSGNYGAPEGLCFDRSCVYCRDDPVVSDARLETFNLNAKTEILVQAIEFEVLHSVGQNVMLKMGADFTYDNANSWYKSLDVLINHVNENFPDKYKLFYSTPDKYTEYRAAETKIEWTVKTDDFFPYADCAHCYWSGYFTSRPTLKLLERKSSTFLQTLRQTLLMTPVSEKKENTELELTAAVGLTNHHDAITGTSKQHVADDYTKILSKALTNAEVLLAEQVAPAPSSPFVTCRYANESTCTTTQNLVDGSVDVLVYNPLPRTESQQVKLYISQKFASIQLVNAEDGNLADIPAVIFPTFKMANNPNPSQAPFTLIFSAVEVKALSSKLYRMTTYSSKPDSVSAELAHVAKEEDYTGRQISLTTKHVSISFDSTGLLSHMARLDPDSGRAVAEADISNDLRYYASFGSPGQPGFNDPTPDHRDASVKNIKPTVQYAATESDESTQASGAYLFRPFPGSKPPQAIHAKEKSPVQVKVINTAAYSEIRQTFSSWATQTIRVSNSSSAVELEWTIGPIPIEDGLGKEVVTKFQSSLNSGPEGANEFFTDSNGREFQQRILNYRPTWNLQMHEPIAGNYYPITAALYLKDKEAKAQLSILSDRSQAASSLKAGEIELMIHRRLIADDQRGVNEALNETAGGMTGYPSWVRMGDGITVTGKHWLVLSELNNGLRDVRSLMDKMYAPMQELFRVHSGSSNDKLFSLGTGLGADLPLNVHLLTLHRLPKSKNTLLLRLAHQFAEGEDVALSQSVKIDLATLLAPFKPLSETLVELNLSGNQVRDDMLKNKVQWNTANGKVGVHSPSGSNGMEITLTPMEIKTFTIEIQV